MAADNGDDHRHADMRRRLADVEKEIQSVIGRLIALEAEVRTLVRDLGRLDDRVLGISAEASHRRNLLLSVAGTVLAGVLVAVLLSGLGALGD